MLNKTLTRFFIYKLFGGILFYINMFVKYGKTPKQVNLEIESSRWILDKKKNVLKGLL